MGPSKQGSRWQTKGKPFIQGHKFGKQQASLSISSYPSSLHIIPFEKAIFIRIELSLSIFYFALRAFFKLDFDDDKEFRSKWVLGQTLELWERCQKPSTLRRFWGFSGDDQERSVHHEICRQSTMSKKTEKLSHFFIFNSRDSYQ